MTRSRVFGLRISFVALALAYFVVVTSPTASAGNAWTQAGAPTATYSASGPNSHIDIIKNIGGLTSGHAYDIVVGVIDTSGGSPNIDICQTTSSTDENSCTGNDCTGTNSATYIQINIGGGWTGTAAAKARYTLVQQTNVSATEFYVVVTVLSVASASCFLELAVEDFGTSKTPDTLEFTPSGTTGETGRATQICATQSAGFCTAWTTAAPQPIALVYDNTTGLSPTSAPDPVTATSGQLQAVPLSWTSVATATTYDVWYSTSSHASTSPMNSSLYTYFGSFSGTSTTLGGAGQGTTYYVRVVAANAAGEGPASAEASATTQPARVSWSATPTTNLTTGVRLQWVQSTDPAVTSYGIFRNGTRVVNVSPVTVTSWTDNAPANITYGVDYTYTVTAISTQGGEGPAATPSYAGHAVQTPVNQIAGFTVTNQSGALRLDWAQTSDTNGTGYDVSRNGTLLANLSGASVVTWSDTNVSPNTVYNYSMQLRSADALGPATANQSGMLGVDSPHHFALTNASSSIVLTWDASLDSNVTSYDVLRNSTLVASVTTPATTWSELAANVTPAANYSYSVTARVSASLASAATSQLVGHIVSTPTTVGGVMATPIQSAIRVSWTLDPEPNILYYAVYRSTLPNATPTTAIATTTVPTLDDHAGTMGVRYYYRILAVNIVGDASTPSADASAVFPQPVSGGGAVVGAPTTPSSNGTIPASTAPASSGSAGGVAGSIASAAQKAGIHVPSFTKLKWWQYALLFLGFLLIFAAFPLAKKALGGIGLDGAIAIIGSPAVAPVAVAIGGLLLAAVYFTA